MFLTAAGLVLGSAEMLSPISWGLQPFRFVALADDDEDRLKTVIQRSVEQKRTNHGQIERSGPGEREYKQKNRDLWAAARGSGCSS